MPDVQAVPAADLAPPPTMPVTTYSPAIPMPVISTQLPTMPVQEHIRRSTRVNKGQTNKYQDFVQQIQLSPGTYASDGANLYKLEDTSTENPSTMYANINNTSYQGSMMYNQNVTQYHPYDVYNYNTTPQMDNIVYVKYLPSDVNVNYQRLQYLPTVSKGGRGITRP
jgi:hypothetical protein